MYQAGVAAEAVSGAMKASLRQEVMERFQKGEVKVLCACDLLNEGWDCPETEVLFMARPTMSKVLYIQQLGRGMRLAEGKESLMVFDFVDNAGQFNTPYSMHRMFRLKEYRPGALVLGSEKQKRAEQGLYEKGERPYAMIDWPVDALDYEVVDIFNWQEEAAGMISQMEFVRRVNVQTETIERYVREGKMIPDLVVPMSEHRVFKYFKEETLKQYAEQFGWTLIDESNRKQLFMDMVRQMDMSYSYKPVLLLGVLQHADPKGRVKLEDLVAFFKSFYAERKEKGLVVEKANSIYAKEGTTDRQIERNILSNPFKRFEDMQMMYHTKTLGVIQVDESVWRKLTEGEKQEIKKICLEKLDTYYNGSKERGAKMDTSKARELLSILADGIDPFTGEILPEDHVCNEPDMIRALHLAVQQLGNVKTSVTRSRPENAGKPWSEEDDRILCEMFERGCKRKEMKEYFKRTGGAIIARLEHLGKI